VLLIGEGRLAGATERGLLDGGAAVRAWTRSCCRWYCALPAPKVCGPYNGTLFLVDTSGEIEPFAPSEGQVWAAPA
jgi:hypothetical protein